MQCGQGKPFTMTSSNPKMGGPAVKSYQAGGVVTGPNPRIDEETRARAMASVASLKSGVKPVAASKPPRLDYAAQYEKYADDNERARTIPGPRFMAAASAKDKPPVVTKEELAKSGMSLRDYMNKQQGLTRRQDNTNPDLKGFKAEDAFLAEARGSMRVSGEAKDKNAQDAADAIDPGDSRISEIGRSRGSGRPRGR